MLRAQRGSHIPTSRPNSIPDSYLLVSPKPLYLFLFLSPEGISRFVDYYRYGCFEAQVRMFRLSANEGFMGLFLGLVVLFCLGFRLLGLRVEGFLV